MTIREPGSSGSTLAHAEPHNSTFSLLYWITEAVMMDYRIIGKKTRSENSKVFDAGRIKALIEGR